jgi:hypothetical protein
MNYLTKIILISTFLLLILSKKNLNAQNTFPTCVACNVGIGTITPNFSLEITSGDINLQTLNNGYRIGDISNSTNYFVLWHNGIITNIM